jgi:hypothetical protein
MSTFLGAAAAIFTAMALWEWRLPRRRVAVGRGRWFGNLGILAIDMPTVRLIAPTAAVGAALLAAERGWSPLHWGPGAVLARGHPGRQDRRGAGARGTRASRGDLRGAAQRNIDVQPFERYAAAAARPARALAGRDAAYARGASLGRALRNGQQFRFNLTWWDRLFGTYREKPAAGEHVLIGLPSFREPDETGITRLLTQPFRSESGR